MTESKVNIIEGVGLLLILLSFFIQLIESDIESEVREAQFYQTQIKLDRLWIIVSKEYSEKHPDLNVHSAIDFESINKDWKYYSQDKEYLESWKKSVYFGQISKMRIWIFVIGSILLLTPKFSSKEKKTSLKRNLQKKD